MLPENTQRGAETEQELIERIRARRWESGTDILEHGEDLTALKELLGHDRFLETVTWQLGHSAGKCDACIKAYEEFQRHKDVAEALTAKILLLLCQWTTPPSVRERVRKAWGRGERYGPDVIIQLVYSAREAEKEAAHRAKQSIAKRRELSFRPRAVRERQKREVDRGRRFDAAKAAVRMLEPDRIHAVVSFLARAELRECKELACQVVNDLRR